MIIEIIPNTFETNVFTFDTIHVTLALLIIPWNYLVSIALLSLFTSNVDTLHNFFETIYSAL